MVLSVALALDEPHLAAELGHISFCSAFIDTQGLCGREIVLPAEILWQQIE